MVKNEKDKRSVRTRKLIRDALLTLSLDKPLDSISITDITTEAGINRSTFYLHYTDVPSVLSDVENTVIEAFSDIFESNDPLQIPHNPYPFFRALTERAEKDVCFTKFITDSLLSMTFTAKLAGRITDAVCKRLSDKFPHADSAKLITTVTFIVSGLVGVYKLWYTDSERPELEEICRISAALVSHGYASIISSALAEPVQE